MRRLLVMIGFAGLLVVGLAAPAAADGHKVTGTMTVSPGSLGGVTADALKGQSCTGSDVSDGFDDISPGAVVVVRNDKGKRIATGVLGKGVLTNKLECVLKFAVSVPTAKLYTFEVAKRGELAYTAKELASNHYRVELSLTDDS